jgi:hypothetical protein
LIHNSEVKLIPFKWLVNYLLVLNHCRGFFSLSKIGYTEYARSKYMHFISLFKYSGQGGKLILMWTHKDFINDIGITEVTTGYRDFQALKHENKMAESTSST